MKKLLLLLALGMIIFNGCKKDEPIVFVTSVAPLTATLGTETIFTVEGTNLTAGMAFLVADLENMKEVEGGNSTTRCFKGLPSHSAGVKDGVIQDASGGHTLSSFSVEFNEYQTPVAFPGETISVTGGTFQMGSISGEGHEQPVHSITVNSFTISKYEITNAQFADFMNAIRASFDGYYHGLKYLDMTSIYIQISYTDGKFVADAGKDNYPVATVTWFGAKAYCEWVGGRLPTEAEWEFAARGGNNSKGYTYAGSNTLDDVAWYNINSDLIAGSVGTKNANELGLHDMSGNLYEWCSDWYSSRYYSNSPTINPQGPNIGTERVCRGGGWFSSPGFCSVTYRLSASPSSGTFAWGFRPVFVP